MGFFMSDKKGASFLEGALILSTAGILAKVMGFGYRIILPRVLGEYGLGLYQMAYPIYTILLVVSRSGIPVSLAKMISDRIARKEEKSAFQIFKVGRKLSIIVGIFFSVLMAILTPFLIDLFSWDSEVLYAILALAPAIFFVSIMATYRGFFQGLQDMVPTACSQVVEQFVRMVTMISLVYLLIPYGAEIAAAGATFGAVTGSIVGLLLLFFIYYKRRESIWDFSRRGSAANFNFKGILKEMVSLGLPVTFGALVLPLMNFVDAAIVPARLSLAGFINPVELFSRLSGMAMVLVNFPAIITISLAASLVPAISEAFAQKNEKLITKRTETALRFTVLIGLPAAVGLFILAEPLTSVIFNSPQAAVPLRIVCWGVIFITLQQTTAAILQGLGETIIPARNLFFGAVINAVINYTLTSMPAFGIQGAALGTVVGFALAAFLNLYYVKKYSNFKINAQLLIFKPVFSVLGMSLVVWGGHKILHNVLSGFMGRLSYGVSTFLIVPVGALIYFVFLLLLKVVGYNDLKIIPKIGPSVAEFLKKMNLVGEL